MCKVKIQFKRTGSKILTSVFIGDIHIGAFEPEVMWKHLESDFIKKIEMLPKIDILFIAGDLFDKLISMNSPHAMVFMMFRSALFKLAKEKGFIIRIVIGTDSHDHKQPLLMLEGNDDVDIKVFDKVTSEKINGYDILYVPEEYIKDQDKYYGEYFEQKYDIIVGHGTFKETSFGRKKSLMYSSPVFDSKQFSNMGKLVVFGHIHNAVQLQHNVFYTGAFDVWEHGQDENRGFLYTTYDKVTGNFKVFPIYNESCRKYKQISIDRYLDSMEVGELEKFIMEFKKSENIYKLNVICNNRESVVGKILALKSDLSFEKDIKVIVKDTIKESGNEELEDMDFKDLPFGYLYEESLSKYDKTSLFIKDTQNKDVSADEIRYLLETDILDILDE